MFGIKPNGFRLIDAAGETGVGGTFFGLDYLDSAIIFRYHPYSGRKHKRTMQQLDFLQFQPARRGLR